MYFLVAIIGAIPPLLPSVKSKSLASMKCSLLALLLVCTSVHAIIKLTGGGGDRGGDNFKERRKCF